jgi:hypothetical protein
LEQLEAHSYAGASVPAEAEYVAGAAEVIRVRVPDDGVWSLPLVLHEYGHVRGTRLGRMKQLDRHRTDEVFPLARHLRDLDVEQPRRWYHRQELFADAFATYIGGPALLAACVCLRFDPGAADDESLTHPSANRRVGFMVDILRRLVQAGAPALVYRIDALAGQWSDIAGRPVEQVVVAPDDARFGSFCWLLLNETLPECRQSGLTRADALALWLRKANGECPVTEYSVIDVLNAAWIARLDEPSVDLDYVSTTALDLIRGC